MTDLPAHAGAKLQHLRQRAADAQALATAAKTAADQARHDHMAGTGEPGELTRCEAEQRRRQDRAAAEQAVLNTCSHYLRTGHAVGAARPVKIPDGATLDKVRAELRAIRLECERVESAPAPRGERAAAIRAAVERLAERGRPVVRQEAGQTIIEHQQADSWGTSKPGPLHTLAWLDGDRLVERLVADLPASDAGAIAAPKRAALLTELGERMAEAERVEEALCMAAEAEGRDVVRRHDVRAGIVLSVTLDETATAKAA